MRLQRMIALSSELSRRAAEKAIAEGRVTVNGEAVTALGTAIDPRSDRVCLDGRALRLEARRNYLAFHKPRGVLVTKSDPHGRPTIWDNLGDLKKRLDSVGRLDFDSDGLLLLTDDGDLLNKLTHPRHEIWKVYKVRVRGVPDVAAMKRLQNGVILEEGKTLPAKVRRVDQGDPNALLEIGLREGKKRQIRRMCKEIGFPVVRLTRTSIGPVRLGFLKPGRWRHLKPYEVAKLVEESGGRCE